MDQYKGLPPSNSPLRVEPPPKLVGVQAVAHHMADKGGALVKTGKVEVRFTSPATKGSRKAVDWQRTAYLAGHEALYAYQYARDQDIKIEDLERRYTASHANSEAYRRDMIRLQPVVNAALSLRAWWGFRFLPKSFRRTIAAEL